MDFFKYYKLGLKVKIHNLIFDFYNLEFPETKLIFNFICIEFKFGVTNLRINNCSVIVLNKEIIITNRVMLFLLY